MVNPKSNNGSSKRRLIIFTSVIRHRTKDGDVGHKGFVKEIEMWASRFKEVVIVSPECSSAPPADAISYEPKNVSFVSLGQPVSTSGLIGKVRLIVRSILWIKISRSLVRPSDVIMARGPDSIGFLGYIISRCRKNIRFAKYADEWQSFAGEPIGYKLQKYMYRSKTFGGPVLIYGNGDPQVNHLISFYPSSLSQEEWQKAGHYIQIRTYSPPFRLLFVGRLVAAKGAEVLLEALRILLDRKIRVTLDIVGDGPERERITSQAQNYGLDSVIKYHGWVGWDKLSDIYSRSNIFVHSSHKEGFGKVLIEAMSYALPIVATDVGVSRTLVDSNRCGIVVKPGKPEAIAGAIAILINDIDAMKEMGHRGRKASMNLLLERQEQFYSSFIQNSLGLNC